MNPVNAWKVIVSTLVIFIAGVVTGGMLVKYAIGNKIAEPVKAQHTNVSANNPWLPKNRELLRRMDRELKLTPEQHAHIEAIIAASQERIKVLSRPIAPAISRELQQTRAEIVKELTPDQQKKFEVLPKLHPGQEKHRNGTNPPSGISSATNTIATNTLP